MDDYTLFVVGARVRIVEDAQTHESLTSPTAEPAGNVRLVFWEVHTGHGSGSGSARGHDDYLAIKLVSHGLNSVYATHFAGASVMATNLLS